MLTLRWVRLNIFCFFGAYSMTAFYNESLRIAGASQDSKSTGLLPWLSRSANPQDTFTTDVRRTIIQNEVASSFFLAAIVLAGGLPAIAGAALCVAIDGPDGPKRYADLKRTLLAN